MIDIANAPEWLKVLAISFLGGVTGVIIAYLLWPYLPKKWRKNEKNGGDTPKGGAL